MRRYGAFSGKSFSAWAIERLDHLTKTHGFNFGDGTAQVQGKNDEIQRAFGEWDMLRAITREFGIGVPR